MASISLYRCSGKVSGPMRFRVSDGRGVCLYWSAFCPGRDETVVERYRGMVCPVILQFEKWMYETVTKTSRNSRIGKAISYTLPLLPRLSRYVNDGRFCIDNNLVENAIRPLALGRKNYLFCGNHDAAVRAAIVYSLVDSCKALDVNPREWMEDVLLRIPGNENNREALRELLPDKWAKQTK